MAARQIRTLCNICCSPTPEKKLRCHCLTSMPGSQICQRTANATEAPVHSGMERLPRDSTGRPLFGVVQAQVVTSEASPASKVPYIHSRLGQAAGRTMLSTHILSATGRVNCAINFLTSSTAGFRPLRLGSIGPFAARTQDSDPISPFNADKTGPVSSTCTFYCYILTGRRGEEQRSETLTPPSLMGVSVESAMNLPCTAARNHM